MPKLKIKPNLKKSQWEIIEDDDIPMAGDGKEINSPYKWSTQPQENRFSVETSENVNTNETSTVNKNTPTDIYWANKMNDFNSAQDDAWETVQRKKRIKDAVVMQNKPLSERLTTKGLATETGAIGDKFRFSNSPNVFDDYINPAAMIGNMASGVGKVPLNLQEGNYGQVALDLAMPLGMGALAGIGTQGMGQFVNNLANPLAGTGDFSKNTLRKSVDLVHPVGRNLKQIEREGLKKGLSLQEIKKIQLENVGITSLQREGYFPGVSEVLSEYLTPYSYENAKKRVLEIPKKIIKGEKNSKILTDDVGIRLDRGETKLSKSRYDAWRMYSGLPQKNNTFRIAETAPINHPSYNKTDLNTIEKFSLNNEKNLLRDLPGEYDNIGLLYNDERLVDNIDYLKEQLEIINKVEKKGIDFPRSDFNTTNVMGGYNRRFFDNKMEYNDIWDLDLNGLKVDKYFGKPFMSHGQLDYSFEPAKNNINLLLNKAEGLKENINTSKPKNYDFIKDSYLNTNIKYNDIINKPPKKQNGGTTPIKQDGGTLPPKIGKKEYFDSKTGKKLKLGGVIKSDWEIIK